MKGLIKRKGKFKCVIISLTEVMNGNDGAVKYRRWGLKRYRAISQSVNEHKLAKLESTAAVYR